MLRATTARLLMRSVSPSSMVYRRARRRPLPPPLIQASSCEFQSSAVTRHGYPASDVDPKTAIKVVFVERDGKERPVLAPPGKSLLEIAHANQIDLEGACEGSLACSTCHVYLDENTYEALEEPCDDENDMLDLAFGLTEL